jgi:hypothetical protein
MQTRRSRRAATELRNWVQRRFKQCRRTVVLVYDQRRSSCVRRHPDGVLYRRRRDVRHAYQCCVFPRRQVRQHRVHAYDLSYRSIRNVRIVAAGVDGAVTEVPLDHTLQKRFVTFCRLVADPRTNRKLDCGNLVAHLVDIPRNELWSRIADGRCTIVEGTPVEQVQVGEVVVLHTSAPLSVHSFRHYAFCVGADLFLSKYGRADVYLCSMQNMVDFYEAPLFVRVTL